MLSPRHHLVRLLAVTLGGLWIAPTALAQPDSCPSFPSSSSSPPPLSGSDDRNLENFGFSVAIDREALAVGAPGHGAMESTEPQVAQTNNIGRVYLFTREGTVWRRQDVFEPDCEPNCQESEIQFGRAVALSGDVLAAGAPEEDVEGQKAAGKVYLFQRADGGTWSELGDPLTAADDENVRDGAKFGFSLGLDGDLLVVGAPFDPTRGRFAGAVFVFRHSDNGWTQEGDPLTARDTAAFDAFGAAVAVSGGRFVVGAPLHDEAGERGNSGAAYLYERDGQGRWVDRKILPRGGPVEDDLYGFAVAMDGDTVVVGARAGDTNRGADTGAAFVFTCGATGCVQQAQLAACDGQPGDELGAAVAVFEDSREDPGIDDGDLVVVGARRNDGAGREDAGAAYIYRLIDGTWTLEARVSADSPASSDQAFGRAVAVAGPHVVTGESLRGDTNAGSAHVFTSRADLGVTELTVEAPPVPGTTVPHRGTFRNDGPSPAIGAELEVVFARRDPASATGPLLSGLTGDCQCQNEQCTEVKGLSPDVRSRRFTALVDLFPGGEVSCDVLPLVAPDARGELIATAEITPPPTVEEPQSEELPNSQELTSTLRPQADLVLETTATPGVVVPGGNPSLYRFTVTNKGPSDVLPGEAVATIDFKIPGSPPPMISIECTADRGRCGRDQGDHRSGQGVFDRIFLQKNGALTYVVRVLAGPSDRGRLDGVLRVTAVKTNSVDDLRDTNEGNNTERVETPLEPRADLVLTPPEPLPEAGVPGGEPSQYEFTVTNNGPSDVLSGEALVTTTHVINGLPKNAPCTSDGTPREPIEGEVSDFITLQRDGMLSYDVTVQISPQDRGRLEGALAVVAMRGLMDMDMGTVPSSNESCVRIPLEPQADLGVCFPGAGSSDCPATDCNGIDLNPDQAVPGSTFCFVVTNAGPSAVLASEAAVEATFGEELTLTEPRRCFASEEDDICGPLNLLCRLPADTPDHGCTLTDSGFQLNPGGELTYTVQALARPVIRPEVDPVIRNRASVRAGGAAPNDPSNLVNLNAVNDQQSLEISLTPVDLDLVKTRLEDEEMDGDRVYCLQVSNQEPPGGPTAEGIRLFDPSPQGLELIAIEGTCPLDDCPPEEEEVDCSAFPCSPETVIPGETCFACDLGDLTAGERVCLTARFQVSEDEEEEGEEGVSETAPIVNLASIASATADPSADNNRVPPSENNGAPPSGEVSIPEDLTVEALSGPIRADEGDDLAYEFRVVNAVSDSAKVSALIRLDHAAAFEESRGKRIDADGGQEILCPESEPTPGEERPGTRSFVCDFGDLVSGQVTTVRVELEDVRVEEQPAMREDLRPLVRILLEAAVEGPDGAPRGSVEILTAIGDQEPADLALEAEVSEQPLPDGKLPVILILSNAGPGPATEVRLEVRPGAEDILRPDAVGLCEEVAPSELRGESDNSFVCLLVDPEPLVPGSVVLLPVTLDLDPDPRPVTFRVTTDAPDPQKNNLAEVGRSDGSPALARPTSLVPRRLGTTGPP